jgi:hypothetical protein
MESRPESMSVMKWVIISADLNRGVRMSNHDRGSALLASFVVPIGIERRSLDLRCEEAKDLRKFMS